MSALAMSSYIAADFVAAVVEIDDLFSQGVIRDATVAVYFFIAAFAVIGAVLLGSEVSSVDGFFGKPPHRIRSDPATGPVHLN